VTYLVHLLKKSKKAHDNLENLRLKKRLIDKSLGIEALVA